MSAVRKHRALPVFTATFAVAAAFAAPAFAGSDSEEVTPVVPPPSPVVPIHPAPEAPAPAPAQNVSGETSESGGSGGSGSSGGSKSSTKQSTTKAANTRTVSTQLAAQTAPQGGVQAGFGGMADQGPDAVLLGLAGGALVLIASGGGLVARARR
jgi:hypothetical protein